MKALSVTFNQLTEAVLSSLIVVYLFFTVTWLSPESETRTRFLEPVKQFWLFWGLDQNWRLFSPVIKDINFHTMAVLTFEDGYRLSWELPRMKRLNYIERFRDEKYRKWCVDSLPWPDYKEFWPDFARYTGRKFYNKANKPVSLSLQLFWIEIPAPGKGVPDKGTDAKGTDDKRAGGKVAVGKQADGKAADGTICAAGALPEHTKLDTVLYYRYRPEDLP
jgi:hypothetical protein